MFQEMTENEVSDLDREVASLSASSRLEDNICGILMDLSSHGVFMYENVARTKAVAILNLLKDKELIQDAERYRYLARNGPPGVHTFITGIYPADRPSRLMDKKELDRYMDDKIATEAQ